MNYSDYIKQHLATSEGWPEVPGFGMSETIPNQPNFRWRTKPRSMKDFTDLFDMWYKMLHKHDEDKNYSINHKWN